MKLFLDIDAVIDDLVDGLTYRAIAEKYNVHPLKVKSAKEYLPYAHSMFNTLNEAFKNLYGFVPLNEKQIEILVECINKINDLKDLFNLDLHKCKIINLELNYWS